MAKYRLLFCFCWRRFYALAETVQFEKIEMQSGAFACCIKRSGCRFNTVYADSWTERGDRRGVCHSGLQFCYCGKSRQKAPADADWLCRRNPNPRRAGDKGLQLLGPLLHGGFKQADADFTRKQLENQGGISRDYSRGAEGI